VVAEDGFAFFAASRVPKMSRGSLQKHRHLQGFWFDSYFFAAVGDDWHGDCLVEHGRNFGINFLGNKQESDR
jgi:hypothetical protein